MALMKQDSAYRATLLQTIQSVVPPEYVVLGLTALYVLVTSHFVPEVISLSNLKDIALQVLPLFIAGMGLMLVLMVAQIDLSATSIMAITSVVGASIMTSEGGYLAGSPWAPAAAISIVLVIGMAIGALNGFCTAFLEVPSFLVTLTTMMFFSGAAIWYTVSGSSIGSLPDGFVTLGYGGLFGLPYAAVVTLVLAGACHILLTRSLLGRWIIAIGLNPRAAAISGVPVKPVIVATFVLSGLFVSIAGIIYTARLEAGTPILGQRILLDIIGSVVIGGVSLFGGIGSVFGVLFGVLFFSVIDNSLQLLGLSLSSVFAIKGGVILFAAVTDALRHRIAGN